MQLMCNIEERCVAGKDDPDVPYTDVVVTQEVQPRRFGGKQKLTRIDACWNFTFLPTIFIDFKVLHCDHDVLIGPVRFRHKNDLVRFKKRSCFGLKKTCVGRYKHHTEYVPMSSQKYLFCLTQTQLYTSWNLVKTPEFVTTNTSQNVWMSPQKHLVFHHKYTCKSPDVSLKNNCFCHIRNS